MDNWYYCVICGERTAYLSGVCKWCTDKLDFESIKRYGVKFNDDIPIDIKHSIFYKVKSKVKGGD